MGSLLFLISGHPYYTRNGSKARSARNGSNAKHKSKISRIERAVKDIFFQKTKS